MNNAEIQRNWRKANLERSKEIKKKSYEKHKEKRDAYNKEYYKKYPEKLKETVKKSYEKHKEKRKEYYKKHPEKLKESQQKYRARPDIKKIDRGYNLKKYGITLEEYDLLLEMQKGVCAICGKLPDETNTNNKYLHVDHCHDTGKIRGLLCNPCNMALGLFKDNPLFVRKAADYLEQFTQNLIFSSNYS